VRVILTGGNVLIMKPSQWNVD